MLKDKGNTCTCSDSYYEGFSKDYELNNGKQNFYIQEIEIYQVSFN